MLTMSLRSITSGALDADTMATPHEDSAVFFPDLLFRIFFLSLNLFSRQFFFLLHLHSDENIITLGEIRLS